MQLCVKHNMEIYTTRKKYIHQQLPWRKCLFSRIVSSIILLNWLTRQDWDQMLDGDKRRAGGGLYNQHHTALQHTGEQRCARRGGEQRWTLQWSEDEIPTSIVGGTQIIHILAFKFILLGLILNCFFICPMENFDSSLYLYTYLCYINDPGQTRHFAYNLGLNMTH